MKFFKIITFFLPKFIRWNLAKKLRERAARHEASCITMMIESGELEEIVRDRMARNGFDETGWGRQLYAANMCESMEEERNRWRDRKMAWDNFMFRLQP